MKTLIIYAHPDTGGHCKAILDDVVSLLKKRSAEFEVIDLYKAGFDPILHEDEHYTAGNKKISPAVKELQAKISDSERLIFIFPIWWSGMPAILKGFFDRVFIPFFAFKYVNGLPVGLLNGRKAAVFTTGGGASILTHIFQAGRVFKFIRTDILGFSGIRAKVFHLDRALKLDKRQKKRINILAGRGISWLMG